MVYILLLNWNGWKDTIECLESVFRADIQTYHVVVCDNGSEDGSLAQIKAWANGQLDVVPPQDRHLKTLSLPPVQKPIRYVEHDRATAECGADKNQCEPELVLIQTGGNLGFAGGNNVGLRYALARDDFDYIWLLNNDTVIKADSLEGMVSRMKKFPDAGICGSTLVYYHAPEKVQARGGATYNKWLGTTQMLGAFSSVNDDVDANDVESDLMYVSGASMLVSKRFLQDVGLMREDYFLYFEELDWATRAKDRYRLCYAPDSIVYHKEGGSIGTNSAVPKAKSVTADYYVVRSRLLFTRHFFPWLLPFIYVGLLPLLINRLRRGQWQRIGMVLSLAFGGWTRGGKP